MGMLFAGAARSAIALVAIGLSAAGCGSASFRVEPEILPQPKVGVPYSIEVTATNTMTMFPDRGANLETRGTLPPGLVFTSGHQGAATLGGTPSTEGSYSFTISAAGYCTNFTCERAERSYTLVVSP